MLIVSIRDVFSAISSNLLKQLPSKEGDPVVTSFLQKVVRSLPVSRYESESCTGFTHVIMSSYQ